ncbi:MAG: hypothetical protein H5T43_05960 [Methanomethylovorans sp.]|jgi:CRISPR-associated exonuclease Cas4|nr:hypothetical protein [Methanomethylovorans sp.]
MSLKNIEQNINVYDFALYLKCPRKVYYLKRSEIIRPNDNVSFVEHLFLKELGIRYPRLLENFSSKADDMKNKIQSVFNEISNELPTIYSSEIESVSESTISQALNNVQACVKDITSNMMEMLTNAHNLPLLQALCSMEIEPLLYGPKMKISGIPAGMIKLEGIPTPVIVKTGKFPEYGIWSDDRLHLAVFTMIAQEVYNTPIDNGIVIYSRSGNIRSAKIRANDRRQVLAIWSHIKKINDGFLPERKQIPMCHDCEFLQICDVKSSLASKFF